MRAPTDGDRVAVFLGALGDELRLARKRRGWTLRELRDRLTSDISAQTIASYELGTRHCSVVRLLELADALDISVLDVLSPALRRIPGTDVDGLLTIDLSAAASTTHATLEPLRRWARSRLDTPEGRSTTVRLDPAALEHLAQVCGTNTPDLIRRLGGHGVPGAGAPRSS